MFVQHRVMRWIDLVNDSRQVGVPWDIAPVDLHAQIDNLFAGRVVK